MVLPKLVNLALSLPKVVTHTLPLPRKQQDYSIFLSQQQAACLLANSFFCTYQRRNTRAPGPEHARFLTINFNPFFCAGPEPKMLNKLCCIFHYFRRVHGGRDADRNTDFHIPSLHQCPSWDNCTSSLSKLHVTSKGVIEGLGQGMLQVDFANKFIGGRYPRPWLHSRGDKIPRLL